MAANPPPRLGAHRLPGNPSPPARRSVLLGGLGAGVLVLGSRLAPGLVPPQAPSAAGSTTPLASTTRRTGAALPAPPPPPPAGARPREPWSSGAIGDWRASAHSASTPEEDARAAAQAGVHLVGDSIATRLLPALRSRLGKRPLSHDVWNGRPTAPALDHLEQAAAEGRLAPTVVAVLGSNDIFDPWEFENQVQRCRTIVGERRLLWVTPYVSRPAAPSADVRNCAPLGLVLERAAAGGGIELVRWFELLARTADRLEDHLDDGVHPTARGAAALADLVTAVLTRSA
ncbi:GDSL-type esterase/lipase family protein [Mobilicoccus massiliensis]|uniref:GDSL-type esterase/lipase family protein n=1 Tax=Mobilicoccus massiliensis TaxID=1522310 RepID=UPI00058F3C4D|nr:GDSL-type esterase/lipase family protein [Mobilicoccus massiliensis]